ncbi:hypothetical protein RHMOL_Rhmol09G0052300 [Rhododendron molle]|uniref:Uncharacterized protein n=1 Tax=Rhododendron molle TaxID=49168 RepID=A0ACC0MB77_RHOML|nr:hypothetical protein RHMOL_Rhmol09G0052300 [Rhododendron molle]
MEAAASQKAAVLFFGLLLVLIIQACNAQICNVPMGEIFQCRAERESVWVRGERGFQSKPSKSVSDGSNAPNGYHVDDTRLALKNSFPMWDLMACRHAMTVTRLRSGPPPPTAKCSEVISRADLRCLCSHKNSKFLPVLGVDPSLTFQLPAKCKIPYPPQC